MGVPTLFRWLRDRYPRMIEQVADKPQIHNLYIDMNGMIHPCFHPEGRPAPRSEAEVFQEIFVYLDRVLQIVSPQRLLYFAVDGPAPRAKLNQQRLRRFVAAYESQLAAGPGRAGEPPGGLDSNQITPGTPFMERLSVAIRQYIASRQTGALRHLKIVFSDARTPGEGEHKIMHFIRSQRQQPGYDPATTHCIHGLDADLIMLALASHEHNFYIFREVVLLDRHDVVCRCCGAMIRKDSQHERCCPNVADQDAQFPIVNGKAFHFLSVRLLRDYLIRDFQCGLASFERALDDFVFLCFLAGNDFLPHVDSMRISDDAIIRIIDVYKRLYVRSNRFITDSGAIDFHALVPFLCEFANMEWDILKSSERRQQMIENSIKQKNCRDLESQVANETDAAAQQRLYDRLNTARGLRPIEVDAMERNKYYKQLQIDPSDKVTLAIEYISTPTSFQRQDYRQQYYKKKPVEMINDMCYQFLRGMYWVCQYYCNELIDWSYYYPYYEAPLIADIASYLRANVQQCQQIATTFDRSSRPFTPYEQLLAVLPPHSRSALPAAFHALMMDKDSPLARFYPNRFKVDISGKTQLYQGTVLLPFIDEQLLRREYGKVADSLDEADRERNRFENEKLYVNGAEFPALADIINRVNAGQQVPECKRVVVRGGQKIYLFQHGGQVVAGQYRENASGFYRVGDAFNVLFNGCIRFHELVAQSRAGGRLEPLYAPARFPEHARWEGYTNQSVVVNYCDIPLSRQFRNYVQLQRLSLRENLVGQQEWDQDQEKRERRRQAAYRDIR